MKGKYQNGWLMKGRNITMDGQFAWKRTEDIEIDFMDLLRRLCMQWKKAVILHNKCYLLSDIFWQMLVCYDSRSMIRRI